MDDNQSSEDDEMPKLSEHAMAALMEFYAEKNATDKKEQNSTLAENWVIKNFKYFIFTIDLQK